MLKVGTLTQSESNDIFKDSDSIGLVPVVSAEWNHNLFNPPYITVAAGSTEFTPTLSSGTVTASDNEEKKNFTTKKFTMVDGKGSVSYTVSVNEGHAYKIVTYVKTNNAIPVMVTAFAEGGINQYGTSQEEATSLGWTKIITSIGTTPRGSGMSSFTYTINVNALRGTDINPIVYFTVPHIFETSYSDHTSGSLWPTDSAFTHFRPGESYIQSGNSSCTPPANYRKINTSIINGYSGVNYSPISPIVQMPSFFFASPPVPGLKSVVASDIAPYKYFVSEPIDSVLEYLPSISAVYEKSILTNKIVIKFNTLLSVPIINIYLDGQLIQVDNNSSVTFPINSESFTTGVLTLYWTGTMWTKTKWVPSTLPKFTSSGTISNVTSFSKITVKQISTTPKTEVSSYTSLDLVNDLNRMQVVEISPRLEVDISDFVQSLSIEKMLDTQNSALPISSVNSNSCNITLSGIPLVSNGQLVSIFSSQSDESTTLLANILRKNIKFYVGFNVFEYSKLASVVSTNKYVPGGVFYSDTWDENDIETVSIQCLDITRYLQSTPAPDYVANLKSVFDIITNILDLVGFTDYNYDSLYKVCSSKTLPMDISYFYCNSKDSTILDTLNKIFVAYQIGAYINEYGVMEFLSLQDILTTTTSSFSLNDNDIKKNGFSVSNKAKPGKVSLRYQSPKVKQSPSLQNVKNPTIKDSSSFLYTASNDVVWQQQSIDSVGFNYLYSDMAKDSNSFSMNVNDLQNIFHTFNRDANGYAFIENEIVSVLYKEYVISKSTDPYVDEENPGTSKKVSVKNDLQLQAEINNFIREYAVELKVSYATITDVNSTGSTIVYTAANNFSVGDRVNITAVNPQVFNISGTIVDASSSWFEIEGTQEGSYVSGGEATISSDYDVLIRTLGNITNVQRGLFGTVPSAHSRITDLQSKDLSEKLINRNGWTVGSSTGYTSIVDDYDQDPALPSIDKIKVSGLTDQYVIVYPTNELEEYYQTYSVKFDMPDTNFKIASGLFFNMPSETNTDGTYYVELQRFNRLDPKTVAFYNPPKYRYLLHIFNGSENEYFADVTGICNSIVNNFSKIIKKDTTTDPATYTYTTDNPFNLKVVHYLSDGEDGENGLSGNEKRILSVFINNIEVTGWNETKPDDYNTVTNPGGSGWKTTEINKKTGMRQKPYFNDNIGYQTKFGFLTTATPTAIPALYEYTGDISPDPISTTSLREIHATEKPLKERSVSYYYQDREFLNGLVQHQNLYGDYRTYMMQTTPEISGINYYDVQYTTPAAVSVDILPIEYMWYYFPGTDQSDQKQYQKKLVDEYSLSYSTPINTGFRAKMAIANNSSNLVFLRKEADELNQVTINLNLWTHEIVAPSDPEILEAVIDPANILETAQLDSEWIQSKQAGQRMLKVISMGIEGFSKTVSLNVFGNPLIQVGDVVTLTYSLNGIDNQKYLVSSVDHTFDQGLDTRLTLNRIY